MFQTERTLGLLLSWMACLGLVATSLASESSSSSVSKEELLGEIAPSTSPDDAREIVSPDGHRIAWQERRGGEWVVLSNGVAQGPECDDIGAIVFSPDGERLAFGAKQGKSWRVIVDGAPGPAYVDVGAPRFSPNGRHVAFRAKTGKTWAVVLDGEAGPAYDEVGEPAFSLDSERVLYPAKRKKKWVVVDGGEESGLEVKEIWRGELRKPGDFTVSGLPWLGFTPDERGLVYFARLKSGWAPVVAGHAGLEFDAVSWPVFFDARGDRYAYAGAVISQQFMGGERAKGQVIVDGVAGSAYEGEASESAGGAMLKSIGGLGHEGLTRGVFSRLPVHAFGVTSPVVSLDKRHVAYAARRDQGDFVVVLDGASGEPFTDIPCGPSFSARGTLFYLGTSATTLSLMANQECVAELPWTKGLECTGFTVDGEHVLFATGEENDRGGTGRVFLDAKVVGEYPAATVTNLETWFLGEEPRFAYRVRRSDASGAASSTVVVNGSEGRPYDEVLSETLKISDDGTFSYVARRGRSYYLVSQVPQS